MKIDLRRSMHWKVKFFKSKLPYIGILYSFIFLYTSTNAQQHIPDGGLEIGDTMPDVMIHNILNYPTDEARLSDFQSELLIIEFSNTKCAPCIASIEKLSELVEKRFQGAFKLLVVGPHHEEKEKVQAFIDERKWTVPYATEDTLLRNKLFPFRSQPPFSLD